MLLEFIYLRLNTSGTNVRKSLLLCVPFLEIPIDEARELFSSVHNHRLQQRIKSYLPTDTLKIFEYTAVKISYGNRLMNRFLIRWLPGRAHCVTITPPK